MPLIIVGVFSLMALVSNVVQQIVNIIIRPVIQHINALDPDVPMSPADAADGVERGRWDMGTGAGMAASSGVGPTVFSQLVDLVGEPPPLDAMLALERRGGMSGDLLTEMFAFSRAKTDWYEQWYDSYTRSMSGADALEARLKGVIDDATAQDYWMWAGGMLEQYQTALDTVGDAIGVVEAGSLFNHGLITADQYDSIILHSRINPQFEPIATLQRFHWLGVFQIAQALKNGTATPDQGTKWMTELGYPADQIAAFVGGASAAAVQGGKNLAESQVTELYTAGAIDTATALVSLANLGYTGDQANFILSVHDAQQSVKVTNAVVTKVGTAYVNGKVDEATARSQLRELGFTPSSVDRYVQLWDVESGTVVKTLTTAEVGAAGKNGSLTWAQVQARYEQMGYSATDAEILVHHYGGQPPPGSPAAALATGT
jgi:hypothetical protein